MASSDILESALDEAFAAPPQISAEPQISQESSEVKQETVVETNLSESSASDDSWKIEYEEQVKSWRARSAEEREKAEKERLRWEAVRAIEKAEAARREVAEVVEESAILPPQVQVEEIWENVPSGSPATATPVTKPADLLDLSASPAHPEPVSELPRTFSQQETVTDESQKWEDVPSVTSSYPSMSFPEHNDTPSPPHPQPRSQQPPNSVTLAIFDSTLSTRTRVTAFLSSLAVNLFLPFVNGVMLGFGEIFAKEVVMGWLGWKNSGPAHTVTNVGIRPSTREERQRREGFR
ncbi:hypothetical protein CPB84DRAFT_1779830 [Gymnopilus junonius]|uniref:Uncharacterized protein n=1 Tax=Gymnopilus junonius TaxID=109634 RepID=A0A9P5NMU4_GYMJU|nr:hypothetical protein CPB84DRAFT_1779830 [Gymnopilus junonius]